MHIARLRKVGESVMVALPPAVLAGLKIGRGSSVSLDIEDQELRVRPARPRYTLAELLAQCNPDIPWSQEDLDWFNGDPVGEELI